jgi:hypothetical protein
MRIQAGFSFPGEQGERTKVRDPAVWEINSCQIAEAKSRGKSGVAWYSAQGYECQNAFRS